ncbi:hypothetical protein C0J09_10900 [Bordetella avium]|uniref:hypothetical protein n=1 Tax=Bordetella avium TaxID=521 RepID=UPI000FD97BE5|nr:hypothetical protein [Bordetella avium]AZY49587.1 hypothetical protein C0J09_10900 [Bordetella avium]
MRFKAIIALTSLIVLAGCANQGDQNSQMQAQMEQQQRQQAAYAAMVTATNNSVNAGEMTPQEGAQRMLTYVRENLPASYGLLDFWNYVSWVTSKFENKEISKDDVRYLIEKKRQEVTTAQQDRANQYNQAQQQAAEADARAAGYMMMQQVNRITDRAVAPPSSLNCISSAMGAGMARTNCY